VVSAEYVAIASRTSQDYLGDIRANTNPVQMLSEMSQNAFKNTVLSSMQDPALQKEKIQGLLAGLDLTALKNIGMSEPTSQGPATFATAIQPDNSRTIG
jgi:hypothetical protein